ncbi:glycosyltransferase family 1 protein [Spirosoma migulaei]
MIITYLFRSPGTGYSIEELFTGIQREIDRQPAMLTTRMQLPYISSGWRSVWRNLRFLRAISGTIFHVTGDVHYAVLALPAARTVLTIHDCSALENNRSRPLRYAFFWLIWYYLPIRRAAVVTVVSEKTQQELAGHIGRMARKAVVITNGYDPAFMYRPTTANKDCPVVLQLGTAPNKNLLRLIAAIEGLRCTLILVGRLSEELIRELKKSQIEYRNYVDLSRAKVLQLYEECDIVTFVSTYEGFGMPILEANAVGRVVITADREPMRTVASDAAHFVDPEDVLAIRQGILRLVEDDAYCQLLREAGRKNAQRYTLSVAAAQYAAIYQKLAEIDVTSDKVL